MADITNIRLTDFIQGLQEEDVLDYTPNAVRAGGNVTLAETIQTRGGISTVDSVGLPANSEIMSIQQVKFPTNEKTFMIAQVKSTVSNASPIEIQPNIDLDLNTPTYRRGLYLFGGTEDGGDGGTNRELSFLSMSIEYNGIPVFAIDFNVGISDTTGNNGIGTELGSIEGYGREYNILHDKYVYRTMYEGPYLYFPDADGSLWATAIQSETIELTLDYALTGVNLEHSKRWPVIAYYDGAYWYSAWVTVSGLLDTQINSFSNTRIATYGSANMGGGDDVPPYQSNHSLFVWPEDYANMNAFSYVANEGFSPYIKGVYAESPIKRFDNLNVYGDKLYDLQLWVDGTCKLWLKFGDYGLSDLSGNMGDGVLSDGSYEDILQDDGSIILGTSYMSFPNQPAESFYDSNEIIIRFTGTGLSLDLLFTGNPTWALGASTTSASFYYAASGEIAYEMICPVWNIPTGSIVAHELRVVSNEYENEFGPYTAIEYCVSASYPDSVPSSTTSYGLYAMPDTLPDTGA